MVIASSAINWGPAGNSNTPLVPDQALQVEVRSVCQTEISYAFECRETHITVKKLALSSRDQTYSPSTVVILDTWKMGFNVKQKNVNLGLSHQYTLSGPGTGLKYHPVFWGEPEIGAPCQVTQIDSSQSDSTYSKGTYFGLDV